MRQGCVEGIVGIVQLVVEARGQLTEQDGADAGPLVGGRRSGQVGRPAEQVRGGSWTTSCAIIIICGVTVPLLRLLRVGEGEVGIHRRQIEQRSVGRCEHGWIRQFVVYNKRKENEEHCLSFVDRLSHAQFIVKNQDMPKGNDGVT